MSLSAGSLTSYFPPTIHSAVLLFIMKLLFQASSRLPAALPACLAVSRGGEETVRERDIPYCATSRFLCVGYPESKIFIACSWIEVIDQVSLYRGFASLATLSTFFMTCHLVGSLHHLSLSRCFRSLITWYRFYITYHLREILDHLSPTKDSTSLLPGIYPYSTSLCPNSRSLFPALGSPSL